jgi:hypothetical protein
MRAINYNLPINFCGNKIEYLFERGIILDSCSDFSILENLFENNFSLKLFKPQTVKSSKSITKRISQKNLINIKQFLSDKKKIVIDLNKSKGQIKNNCFINNNGVLIQINQQYKLLNPKPNFFEGSHSKTKRKNKINKKIKLNEKNKSIKKNRKNKKSTDLKNRKGKRKSLFYLNNRFNDSRKKKINPNQIKKKIPIGRLLKKKSKNEGFEKSINETKKISNNSSEYRSMLDKQNSYVDSR